MEEVYDLVASLLATKADEQMIGFAGFSRLTGPEGPAGEGILKVAAFHRPKGSGYLTLTFIQDRTAGTRALLGKLDQAAFHALLGPDFEMLIEIPLDAFASAPDFLIEELDVYFHHLQGRERRLLETRLLPALSQVCGLEIRPLQDWRPPGR